MGIELIIFLIIIGIILIIVIPIIKMRFATAAVLKIFYSQNALAPENAKTADALEITSQGVFDRLIKSQDYKPHALQILKNAQVIKEAEGNKLYLDDKNLAASVYYKHLPKNNENKKHPY